MEFKQIRTFLEICRRGSFQEAASHMALTQPALSRQVALLETELGVELFDRRSRKIRLTPSGELFRVRAERLRVAWEDTLLTFQEDGPPSGEYRISTGGTIAAWILPPILLEIRKRSPDIKFRIFEGDARETRAAVTHGEVDLGILSGPARDRGIASSYFLQDRIVPVVARNHPLLKKKKSPVLSDLEQEDFVLFHAASDIRRIMELRFASLPFKPDSVMEVRSLGSVIRSVESGLGIGFLSSLSVTPKLCILEIPELSARRDFYFWHREDPGRGLSLILEWMRSWAERKLKI